MTDVVEVMARAIDDVRISPGLWQYENVSTTAPELGRRMEMRAALTALESAGWCVVPKKLTDEMANAVDPFNSNIEYDELSNYWSAMLSSAPKV